MKKVLIGLVLIVLLIVGAAVLAPYFISKEWVVTYVLQQVKAKTGRDATVDGPIKLALLPRLQIEASDVTFANAPGGAAPHMATIKALKLQLQLMPLVSGQVAIDSFVLTEPVIALEVDKQGRPNWSFAQDVAEGKPAPGSQPAPAPAAAQAPGGSPIGDIQLGDVRLVNGTISYADARTGAKQTISGIDATVSLPNLDSKAGIKGNLTWNGKKVDLTLDVAKARALLTGEPTQLGLKVSADTVKAGFNGSAKMGGTPEVSGTVDLDVPSIRELAAWTGNPIAFDRPNTLGPLKIKGKAAVNGSRASFTDAAISLDAINSKGELTANFGGAKPAFNGRLDVDRLDLNPYLPPESGAKPAAGARPAEGPGAAPKNAGWSTDPIDLSPLRAANADLALSTGSLQYKKIAIGQAALGLKLQDGRLTADLSKLALYEGSATGRLSVDGSGQTPAVGMTFKLTGLQAEPALRDTIDFERLSGHVAGDIDVNTRGGSQKAMIEALAGKGDLHFTDGAIKGINLAAMVRNVSSAFLDSGARSEQKTDFSELGGTFTIAKGIVTNNDLAMKAPLIRLKGSGTVDLPQQSMRYRVEPEVVASVEGQGGRDAGGIGVPVMIEGPWSNLSYRPDLSAILKDPNKALDAVKGLVPGQSGSGLPGILGGGSSGSDSQTGGSGGLPTQLKGLFGR